MQQVFIIHGWAGSPNEPLHVWLESELEEKGFRVTVPAMPNRFTPKIDVWVEHIKNMVETPNGDTYFIGHSIGCQAVLRYLATLSGVSVGGALFIAPWMRLDEETIREEGDESVQIAKPWMETPIDFEKIRKNIKKVTTVFSDNDPYVSLSEKDIFEEELSAKVVVEHNKGHFTKSDGTKESPTILSEFLKIVGV